MKIKIKQQVHTKIKPAIYKIIRFLRNMGNKIQNFATENPSLPHSAYWVSQPPPIMHREASYGNFETLRNKLNGKMMDKYEVQFASLQQQKAYEYYCKIRSTSPFVVGTINYVQLKPNFMCGSGFKSYLYIEHFPVRLCDLEHISFYDGIYILLRALQGFSQIIQQIGIFGIKQSFICITKAKQVKVWINSNLSQIQRQYVIRDTNHRAQETVLIKLIKMVEQRQQKENDKLLFSQFCFTKRNLLQTFKEAKELFKIYCRQSNIIIPNHITHSLHPIIHPQTTKKRPRRKINLSQSRSKSKTIEQFQKQEISNGKNKFITQSRQLKDKIAQQLKIFQSKDCERKRTLAQNLPTQTSQIVSLMQSKVQEHPSRITPEINIVKNKKTYRIDINRINNIHIAQQIKIGKDSTSSNTPREQLKEDLSSYKTISYTVALDSQIAEDLVKYL